MRNTITRVLTLIMVCTLLLPLFSPVIALAQQEDFGSTASAPAGYKPENTFLNQDTTLQQEGAAQQGNTTPRVLLIEDVNPWNSTANQIVLSGITQYDKVTTRDFLNVELGKYGVVVFANDQPFATYDNYAEFKEYLEVFASIGGVIVFGACDAGWAQGNLIEKLPGDVSKRTHYVFDNYVVNSKHAIVNGTLTDGVALQDKDLHSYYCSHVSFDENSLPAGSNIILREKSTNRPTLVEYPLGKGRVIASGLTWEHNWVYGNTAIGSVHCGEFAKIAMEDMFRYAIRVSNIQADEIHKLNDWKMKRNVHGITVVVASCDMLNLTPIAGATVQIGNDTLITDQNGQVFYTKEGQNTVTVSADGYRKQKVDYNLVKGKNKIFFMEKYTDQKPFPVQVTGRVGPTSVDLRSQIIHFKRNATNQKMKMTVLADWNGHAPGKIVLFQGATALTATQTIILEDGVTQEIEPGTAFEEDKAVKLQLIAADGAMSSPVRVNIYIDKPLEVAFGNAQPETYIDIFGSHKVESQDQVITKLLQLDFSLKSELIPIEIVREPDADGTVTWRGVLGFAKGEGKKFLDSTGEDEPFKMESAWKTFKEEIKDFKKAANPKAYFSQLKKKWGKDWKPTVLQKENTVSVDIAGFIEGKFDKNGRTLSVDGGVIINGAYNFVVGKTFAGPVPMYFELSLGTEIDVHAALGMKNENDKWKFSLDGNKITISLPKISLEGGLGVRNVATAGLNGTGKVDTEIGATGSTADLDLNGALHIKVIFVVDFNWNFYNTKIHLWPNNKNLAQLQADGEGVEKSLASREYLDYRTAWNPGTVARRAISQSLETVTTLQQGVMPDALPRLAKVGNQLVMLFLQDEGNRSLGNHTRLVYSIYENGAWSEPNAVWESDTADFFFDLVTAGDRMYAVWHKSKAIQQSKDPDELIAQVAEASEICIAEWNPASKRFVNQQYITSDGKFDMMPKAAVNGDTVSVVWATSNYNGVAAGGVEYTINQADFNRNGLIGRKQLYTTSEYIGELAAGYKNGKLHVVSISMDENGTNSVYHFVDGAVSAVTTNGNPAGLSFEESDFMWSNDGKLIDYNPATRNMTMYTSSLAAPHASYQYITNGDRAAIVWATSGDEGNVKAAVRVNNSWGEPVDLLDDLQENITSQDAVMLDDGSYAIVLNTAEYSQKGLENTALKFIVIQPRNEVELMTAVVDVPNWETRQQEIFLAVKNNGTEYVSEANIQISAGATTLLNQTAQLALMPGEEKTVAVTINPDALQAVTPATITVSVPNDAKPDNNRANTTLGCVDARFAVDAYERNNNVIFQIAVVNNSNTPANAALSIVEDSPDGIVLDMKNIGVIDRGYSSQYMYVLDKSKINFKDGVKNYFFLLDTLEEDWIEEDNQLVYSVSSPLPGTDSGHAYGLPVFRWTSDYGKCTAVFTCTQCGEKVELPCDVTHEVIEATKNDKRKEVFTATVVFQNETFTDVKSFEIGEIVIPQTNDPSHLLVWIILLMVGCAGVIALVKYRKA